MRFEAQINNFSEKHQPSGTCNFSMINSIELIVNPAQNITKLISYSYGYNIFRVASGMGCLVYIA